MGGVTGVMSLSYLQVILRKTNLPISLLNEKKKVCLAKYVFKV